MKIDPDKYFYRVRLNITKSYFCLESDFSNVINTKTITSDFSIIHINARSLSKNIDSLSTNLNTLDHSFSVIAITETCGNENNDQFLRLDGYNRVCRHRPVGRGGEVVLFIKDAYKILFRLDLDVHFNDSFDLSL